MYLSKTLVLTQIINWELVGTQSKSPSIEPNSPHGSTPERSSSQQDEATPENGPARYTSNSTLDSVDQDPCSESPELTELVGPSGSKEGAYQIGLASSKKSVKAPRPQYLGRLLPYRLEEESAKLSISDPSLAQVNGSKKDSPGTQDTDGLRSERSPR